MRINPFFRIAVAIAAISLVAGLLLTLPGTARPGLAVAALAICMTGLIALYAAWQWQREQYERLRQLQAEVMMMTPGRPALSRRTLAAADVGPVGDLTRAIADRMAVLQDNGRQPDRRLQAVIECLDQGVAIITGEGLISLINAPAAVLLDSRRARVGTSIFNTINRIDVIAALQQARRTSGCVSARMTLVHGGSLEMRAGPIAGHRGAVLVFAASRPATDNALAYDLSLHDEPPTAPPPTDHTRLDVLPWLCLDTETTGLEPARDRIVSLAAIPGHGMRLYAHLACDELVNPGVPIPPVATAIHGLGNDLVATAQPFSAALQPLVRMMSGRVVIGHNIGFDLAVLAAECARHGLPWSTPRHLDTFALAIHVLPEAPAYSLDALAEYLGLEIRGRHTALGDSLVTGDLFLHLLPRLAAGKINTLGQATTICRQRDRLAKRAGWQHGQP